MTEGTAALPPSLRAYLSVPSLRPVWTATRALLERNGLQPTGAVSVRLDELAAEQLSGLMGRPIAPGAGCQIKLAELDEALRGSKGGRGLVSVIEILDGQAVTDRRAVRNRGHAEWAGVWQRLDAALHEADLAGASWVPEWITALRRTGILTRAGTVAAGRALDHAVAGLVFLLGSATGRKPDGQAEPTWELGALASRVTGTAHGFDETTLASTVLLRGAAYALDRPVPESAADRRDLWGALGVATDMLSGTVLAWQIRPPGDDSWSRMMRERADLGLAIHLTLQELAIATPAHWSEPEQVVSVCENPQVMQAAIRAGAVTPLLCLSGNPARAGTQLLDHLITAGICVRYHGDFDWPGVAIAGRIIRRGVVAWRMSAQDYVAAVADLDANHSVPLTGRSELTEWDPALAAAMSEHGLAVHEEFVLSDLLADLGVHPAAEEQLYGTRPRRF